MITLCQDCLRVIRTTPEEYKASDYGKGLCSCRGDVCHCQACISLLWQLLAGDYHVANKNEHGLTVAIKGWTATEGVVL